jgi:hypothetical protein
MFPPNLKSTKHMTDTVRSLELEQIAETLRAAGLRATVGEQDGRRMIQSAVQGMGFIVVPGNRAPDAADRYVDLSFTCLIATDGGLDPGLVAEWNTSKRFARMFTTGKTLVITMDVFIGGGDPEHALRGYCELWDRVMHEFIAFVRSFPAARSTAKVANAK